MKIFVLLFLLSVAYAYDLEKEFAEYKRVYNKVYAYDSDEYFKSIFNNSLRIVEFYNNKYKKGEIGYITKINKYADMDVGSYSMLGGLKKLSKKEWDEFMKQLDKELMDPHQRGHDPPPFIDWSAKGKLQPIQDQGDCGSCYAFATTAAIEAHHAITNNVMEKLSEQQLVDCSEEWGNNGCGGGYMTSSYDYFIENNIGHMKGTSYKYDGYQGICGYDAKETVVKLGRYRTLPEENEDLIMKAVGLKGPVAAGIDATRPGFQFYSDGIYDDPECKKDSITHAILIVGYGTLNGTDYWIIRNSMGTSWGRKGYGLVKRGVNQCGIAKLVSYPIVKKVKKGPRKAGVKA